MNNKDLFNAINDIDEKFIEDAAKYLNDDDSDDPLHGKAVEIFPKNAVRFSPIKLAASIAAAAVFITGVTFAVKHFSGKLNISPNAGASENTGEQNPNPDIGTHAVTAAGQLPFELIGPDDKQIRYEDITNVSNNKLGFKTPTIAELSEDNWDTVTLDFAYYALPSGINYNSIDDAEIDYDKTAYYMMRSFRRIYAGNTYIDLTVQTAYSKLKRETFTNPETGETSEVTYLSENYIAFDGETTADVLIVNDSGNYCCIFRNGADNFPIVGYDVPEYLENNAYSSKLCTLENKNGFRYSGDMPVMWLDDEEKALVEPALSNANYLRATVTFTNITLKGTQDLVSTGFDINADIARIDLKYVEPVVTTDNLFGETPFDVETEMQLRSILGSAEDIWELKTNEEVMSLTGCNDIRVYKGSDLNGNFGEELFSGTLESGNRSNSNVIVLYSNGEIIAAYDYFKYNLVKRSE